MYRKAHPLVPRCGHNFRLRERQDRGSEGFRIPWRAAGGCGIGESSELSPPRAACRSCRISVAVQRSHTDPCRWCMRGGRRPRKNGPSTGKPSRCRFTHNEHSLLLRFCRPSTHLQRVLHGCFGWDFSFENAKRKDYSGCNAAASTQSDYFRF